MRFKPIIRKKYVPALAELGFDWRPVDGGPVEDFVCQDEEFYIRFGVSHRAPAHIYAEYDYQYPGPMLSLNSVPAKYLVTKNVFYQTQDELNRLADSILEDTVSFFIPVMRKLRPHAVAPDSDQCCLYCNEFGAAEFAAKFHLPKPHYGCDVGAVMCKVHDIFSSWIAPDIDLRTECYQAHEIDLYQMGAYLGEWERLRLQAEAYTTVESWQWVEMEYNSGDEIFYEKEWGLAFWVEDELENLRRLCNVNPMIPILNAWTHYPYYDRNPFEHMGPS